MGVVYSFSFFSLLSLYQDIKETTGYMQYQNVAVLAVVQKVLAMFYNTDLNLLCTSDCISQNQNLAILAVVQKDLTIFYNKGLNLLCTVIVLVKTFIGLRSKVPFSPLLLLFS